MAITHGDCVLWRELRRQSHIIEAPAVLEIGRANWYGDVPREQFLADLDEFGVAGDTWRPAAVDAWGLADWYYHFMLRKPLRRAIDLDPNAADCERLDLNEPVFFEGQDIIINTGTCEHVFDQRQVWETMHDACRVGGLMVHALPLWGWLDHGFYNYQPTFVADVAAENGYEIVSWLVAELKPAWAQFVKRPADIHALAERARQRGAMMHVALRRTRADGFRVSMQGVYSSRATAGDVEQWLERR